MFDVSKIKYYLYYVFGDILNKAMPFLLLPFLTRVLTPQQYGEVAEFTSLFNLCFLLGTFSSLAFFRKLHFEDKKLGNYYISALILSASTITFLCFIYYSISYVFRILESINFIYLTLMGIGSLSLVVNRITTNYFNCIYNVKLYFLFNVVSTAVNLALTYLLLCVYSYPLNGRVTAICITPILISPISIFFFAKYVGGISKFKVSSFKSQVAFGVPLIIFQVSSWAKTSIDRLFISSYIDMESLGIYAANSQLALVIFVIFTSLNVAISPKILAKMKNDVENSFRFTLKFFALFLALFLIFVPSVFIFAEFILGHEYTFSPLIVLTLSLSYLFSGFAMLLNHFFIQLGFGKELSKIALVGTILYLAVIFSFIDFYGVTAVLISTLITSIFVFLATIVTLVKRIHGVGNEKGY